MASNIEKFLIEFGFKDNNALKKLKEFSEQYDKLQSKINKTSSSTQRSNRASSQAAQMDNRRAAAAKKLNNVYAKRLALEARVARMSGAFTRSASFQSVQATDSMAARNILNRFQTGIRKGDEATIQAARSALKQYGDEARRVQRKVLSLKTAQNGLTDSTRNMIRAYASLYTAFAATSAINKTGQSFEAMNSAMLAAMGNQEAATKNVQFLDKMTSRLGLSLLDTADQYTKFVFASKGKMGTDEVNEFFNSVAEAGTVLGISQERMKLSFNALQQIS